VSETPTGGDVQGATQPSQRVVKWSETPDLPLGDVVQDVTEGPYGQQGHTPQPSETGGPIPCGVGGEAFDSSNCTLEETLDVTTDNRNLSDEEILPRPCSGSPTQKKKVADGEGDIFHPGEDA
jgi:hypothetical protein